MVPAGEGNAAECAVSCKWGHEFGTAIAPCRVISASVSQSSSLEEPSVCTQKNSAELKPVGLCKTALHSPGTCVPLAGPSRDWSRAEIV